MWNMKRTATLLTAVLVLVACTPSATQPTDRVILLGQIVTMSQPEPAEAIAYEDGVVLAAGRCHGVGGC